MLLTRISAADAIEPGGHYAQAVAAGGLIFVSGQLGVGRGEDPERPVEEQVRRVLQSLERILAARGAAPSAVVKTSIYITNIDHWPIVDRIYADFFGDHKPARSIVPVPALHYGAAIEIEAVAVDPGGAGPG